MAQEPGMITALKVRECKKKSEMEMMAAQIAKEEEKISWAKAKIVEENEKVKPKKKN